MKEHKLVTGESEMSIEAHRIGAVEGKWWSRHGSHSEDAEIGAEPNPGKKIH
jgi:hypothetical protein